MLPITVAAALLLASGAWWTALILVSAYWERRYETPGRREERLGEKRGRQDGPSPVVGAIMLFVPSAVTLGLALDGLSGSKVIFYAPGWSWVLPASEALQALGTILVFIAAPLFTWTVYVIQRYVYARQPSERTLIQRGPYASIRHPMHLGVFLLAIGWILLAQNFVALVFLVFLQGIMVAKREEAELIEAYGEAYRDYQKRTGFFFPRLRMRA